MDQQAGLKNVTDNLNIFEILKFVRFPFIPHIILLDEVLQAPLVYESQRCRSLVIQAIKFHGDSFTQPLQEGQQYAPRGESKLVLIPCGERDTGYLVKDTETKMYVFGDTEDGPFTKEDEVRTFPFSFAFRSVLVTTKENCLFLFGVLNESFNSVALRFCYKNSPTID